MTEARPGWSYQGIHLRIHQDLPAAARAYVELVRSAKSDGTLIQHRAPGMSVDLTDGRTVKFISRADASRPQGWAIASFEVAEGVDLGDTARALLLAATASAGAQCECDDFAHLGTHSTHDHRRRPRPHPMGE